MLELSFTPFPQLTTPRLLLRQQTVADKHDLFYLRSHPGIMHFIPRPLHQNLDDTLQFIEMLNTGIANRELIHWVITLAQQPERVIGCIGFVRMKKEHYRSEVGYLLHDGYRGQGIMQEALQAVLHYGFNTMGLHSVEAVIDPANTASAAVLEKGGFTREGYFREDFFYNGKFYDTAFYSLLAREHRP
ncbi:ribosomal-protein-alanine N-acetyltransferase [Filimonas zeae]|nr:GNAT family N-acetyltransferase [Filimonas zeae]MDR6339948.1 ribosomal-protein-alanine N-acetyltransferase [Filimonas zeae]